MNRRIRIKVCGITQVEDALACVNYGVDAIGLVFYPPSPRNLDVDTAGEIISSLPPFISTVALFMNPDVATVESVLSSMHIDCLQFHGSESGEFCEQFATPYFKAVAMGGDHKPDFDQLNEEYQSSSAFLLDSNVKGQAGGSGEVFDWLKIPENIVKPVILAGGLTPDNVQLGIQKSSPYAIDCSSGVESSPGIKDHDKIQLLVEKVNNVITSH